MNLNQSFGIFCGTTNCSNCGGAAPTRTCLCGKCSHGHADYDEKHAKKFWKKHLKNLDAQIKFKQKQRGGEGGADKTRGTSGR